MSKGQKGLRIPEAADQKCPSGDEPTSIAVAFLIAFTRSIRGEILRIETYQAQYELKDPAKCQTAQPSVTRTVSVLPRWVNLLVQEFPADAVAGLAG